MVPRSEDARHFVINTVMQMLNRSRILSKMIMVLPHRFCAHKNLMDGINLVKIRLEAYVRATTKVVQKII